MLQRYPTIAVGMDFSPLAEVGLDAAAAQADRLGSSRLHLVHVYEHRTVLPLAAFGITAGPPPEVWEEARRGVHQRLEAIPVSGFNGRITRETRLGAPAEELIAASTEAQASLLLVASHDRVPAQRVVLGSVASTLLRASHCPVMVVGRDRPGAAPIRLVLAAVGLSVITLLEKLCPSSVEVEVEVMSDDAPPHAILAASERYRPDLIVLGTSGHNAWQRFFLGSTATRVVADAHCPVFVVPHELAKVKDSTPSVIPTPVLAP